MVIHSRKRDLPVAREGDSAEQGENSAERGHNSAMRGANSAEQGHNSAERRGIPLRAGAFRSIN